MPDRQYAELANSIIKLAVRDYTRALTGHGIDYPNLLPMKDVEYDCRTFFHSDWCETLAGMDGTIVTAEINRAIRDGNTDRLIHLKWSKYADRRLD